MIAAQGPGVMLIKQDLQDAFRHIPIASQDLWLLGFCWEGTYCVASLASRNYSPSSASYRSAAKLSPLVAASFAGSTMRPATTPHSDTKRRRLTAEMKADLRWWKQFLPSWNGIAVIRPARATLLLWTGGRRFMGDRVICSGGAQRGARAPRARCNNNPRRVLRRALP